MELSECIRNRRSIRKYHDKPIPWDDVVQVLQSAKYAPFAGNIMSCKLLVIKNEEKRKAIAQASSQQYWMQDAPIHIVVVGEPEKIERYYGTRGTRLYSIQGIASAIENMLLTATSLGLGSCWVGAFDEDEIRTLCNLPEHVNVQGIITLGNSAEKPSPPPKYRIEHYIFFEKWWGRIEPPKTGVGFTGPYVKSGLDSLNKSIKNAIDGFKSKKKKDYPNPEEEHKKHRHD